MYNNILSNNIFSWYFVSFNVQSGINSLWLVVITLLELSLLNHRLISLLILYGTACTFGN